MVRDCIAEFGERRLLDRPVLKSDASSMFPHSRISWRYASGLTDNNERGRGTSFG
jgi:hypothetical protein